MPSESAMRAAEARLHRHLRGMMDADMALYEKCLDTATFAFHFNAICNMARGIENIRKWMVLPELEAVAEAAERYLVAIEKRYGAGQSDLKNSPSGPPPEATQR